jgi:hypothetical protein
MREVVLGRSAKIWQAIARRPGMAERFQHAVGHAELGAFVFTPQDRVWVFAYSRAPRENTAMLSFLARAGVAEVVYVTSSSTIIAPLTDCYEYPRAKKQAEDEAFAMPHGRVLTLGLVVETEEELPAGANAATTIDEIARFMLAPQWRLADGKRTHLLRIVQRPFEGAGGGAFERELYALYGALMSLLARKPCVLRPLDLVLRVLGMRWYGYTFLSNRLWTQSMTS